jgi:hypothetical protein
VVVKLKPDLQFEKLPYNFKSPIWSDCVILLKCTEVCILLYITVILDIKVRQLLVPLNSLAIRFARGNKLKFFPVGFVLYSSFPTFLSAENSR